MTSEAPASESPTPSQSDTPTPDPSEAAAAQPFLDQLAGISDEQEATRWLMSASDQLDEPELGIVVHAIQAKFPGWAQHEAAAEEAAEGDDSD